MMKARMPSLASRIFSESIVAIGIGIGVILIWIASLVATFGTGTDAADATAVLINTGLTLISLMLISGGAGNAEIENPVRIAMVVMGAIILLVLVLTAAMATLF